MLREKPRIFLSHIHEDAHLAAALKQHLEEGFLGLFDVFAASDGSSIRVGDNWSASLERALVESDLLIVLLSTEALERRWIYFEAGGAYFSGKRVIPVCCGGLKVEHLGAPLSWLQAVDATDQADVDRLIGDIATLFGLTTPKLPSEHLAGVLSGRIRSSSSVSLPPDAGLRPLPVFFLLDASGSMAGTRCELMRNALRILVDLLQDVHEFQPVLAVLTFGSEARLVITPTPVSEIREVPVIQADGSTELGAGLELLARTLDNPGLLPTRTLRPLVVVTLDGSPTDDWQHGLNALERSLYGAKSRRLSMAFGTDANYEVLHSIGNAGVLPLVDPEDMLQLASLIRWVSAASLASQEGDQEWQLPQLPEGIADAW